MPGIGGTKGRAPVAIREETASIEGAIVFIMAFIFVMGRIFTYERLPDAIASSMLSITDNKIVLLLLINFFRVVGVEVRWHIPNRLTEGYGLNSEWFLQDRKEGRLDVDVHDFVPAGLGKFVDRCPPGRTGIVYQDIELVFIGVYLADEMFDSLLRR